MADGYVWHQKPDDTKICILHKRDVSNRFVEQQGIKDEDTIIIQGVDGKMFRTIRVAYTDGKKVNHDGSRS